MRAYKHTHKFAPMSMSVSIVTLPAALRRLLCGNRIAPHGSRLLFHLFIPLSRRSACSSLGGMCAYSQASRVVPSVICQRLCFKSSRPCGHGLLFFLSLVAVRACFHQELPACTLLLTSCVHSATQVLSPTQKSSLALLCFQVSSSCSLALCVFCAAEFRQGLPRNSCR